MVLASLFLFSRPIQRREYAGFREVEGCQAVGLGPYEDYTKPFEAGGEGKSLYGQYSREMMMKRNSKGFTLIELLVVIAIIAI